MKNHSWRMIGILLLSPLYIGWSMNDDRPPTKEAIAVENARAEEEIQWHDLSPNTQEYLRKRIKIDADDVSKIYRINDDMYRIILKSERNVYEITNELKILDFSYFNVAKEVKAKVAAKSDLPKQKNTADRRMVLPRNRDSSNDVKFSDLPENIQQYMLKRLDSDLNNIFRITKELDGFKYRVILKKSYKEIRYNHDRRNITLLG